VSLCEPRRVTGSAASIPSSWQADLELLLEEARLGRGWNRIYPDPPRSAACGSRARRMQFARAMRPQPSVFKQARKMPALGQKSGGQDPVPSETSSQLRQVRTQAHERHLERASTKVCPLSLRITSRTSTPHRSIMSSMSPWRCSASLNMGHWGGANGIGRPFLVRQTKLSSVSSRFCPRLSLFSARRVWSSLRHSKLAERPPRRRPSGGRTALEPRPNKHRRILPKKYPKRGDPGGASGLEQNRLDLRKEPGADAQ